MHVPAGKPKGGEQSTKKSGEPSSEKLGEPILSKPKDPSEQPLSKKMQEKWTTLMKRWRGQPRAHQNR